MRAKAIYEKLTDEEKRTVRVGLYARSINSLRELTGCLDSVFFSGDQVRRGMNVNASLMAEELGQVIAERIGLEG